MERVGLRRQNIVFLIEGSESLGVVKSLGQRVENCMKNLELLKINAAAMKDNTLCLMRRNWASCRRTQSFELVESGESTNVDDI